jgi:hypothetical protein
MGIISKFKLYMSKHFGYPQSNEAAVAALVVPPRDRAFSVGGGTKTMNGSLLTRNVIRLILTAPPAKVLSGEPTEKFSVITVPPA